MCERSLETFDKISRQSNQELLAQEKFFCPEQIIKCCEGRESDFYAGEERGEPTSDGGGGGRKTTTTTAKNHFMRNSRVKTKNAW